MSLAVNQICRVALAVVLVGLHPWIAAADEKHPKAAKAGGNGNASANAARVANATQHKAMVQQQVAIQRQNMLQQQNALHQNALQHQNNLQHNGVGTENRLAHRTGVGTENRAAHRTGVHQNRNLETGPMVSSLHSVVGHLNQADHDYDGHRVQAIHSLGQAIHTLQAGTNGNRLGTGVGTGVGAVGRTNTANHAIAHTAQGKANSLTSTGKGTGTASQRMSQAESDAHLRQAHQELTALESHISGGNGTLAAHHQQAHSHIQQALQHLNMALATR